MVQKNNSINFSTGRIKSKNNKERKKVAVVLMSYLAKNNKNSNEFYAHNLSICRILKAFQSYTRYYTTNKRSFFSGSFNNIIKRAFINNFRYLFINRTKTSGFAKLLNLFIILFFNLSFGLKLNNDIPIISLQ